MAAICALAGLVFEQLVDFSDNAPVSALRQASAAFVAVAAVSFVITVEQRRWLWSLAFALGWGLIVALVGWFTAGYNQQLNIFEMPFFAGVFAVLLAAPLFQSVRDEGAWRFAYPRVHGHAWTDAVIGAASLAFVGVTFLLAWLIAGLFDLIGIAVIKDLLRKEWFGWMLAGFAFGSAVGLLRERDQLAITLQRLVVVVLGVLAPVLAVALALFLLSLPFTGLSGLWDSSIPATPLMLVAGAGAILLANAVIGDGEEDRSASRVLRMAALALVLAVLPLAIIAALSLAQRIDQYGWTPERIWGAVAVGVALVYGAFGWWAVAKRRERFDEALRPLQIALALGLCGVAVLLALPILDFGAISARSQMARLSSGQTKVDAFDWKAMAFDFGPAGRRRLADISIHGPAKLRPLAAAALKSGSRYEIDHELDEMARFGPKPSTIMVFPAGTEIPVKLREALLGGGGVKEPFCNKSGVCRLYWQPGSASAIAFLDQCAALPRDRRDEPSASCARSPGIFELRDGVWTNLYLRSGITPQSKLPPGKEKSLLEGESKALDRGEVEVRTITKRQLYIGGRPAGEVFD